MAENGWFFLEDYETTRLRDYETSGLRDYGTTRLRDIAGDARVVSLARFPGVLRYSQAFSVLPSKSRASTSRATTSRLNRAPQPRAPTSRAPTSRHNLALHSRLSASPNNRTHEQANAPFARSFVRPFARSLVRSFARSPVRPFARSLVRLFGEAERREWSASSWWRARLWREVEARDLLGRTENA